MLRRFTSSTITPRFAARFCSTSAAPTVMTPCTMLTEEERALQESVRQFAKSKLEPLARQMDEEEHMPQEIITEGFKAGLMGIETSAELGGAGMNFMSSILAIEELARVDAGYSVMVDVQNTLTSNILYNFGNEAQQKKYLSMMATNKIACFNLTEPGSGSDAFALKTKAERKGNKWVINGSKIYITNGGIADIFLILATVDSSKGYKGITCFIADKEKTPGIKIGRKEKKLGIRSSTTNEILFENVEVGDEDIIGEVGKGYKIAIECLNEGRIGIAAQMIGIAQGALDYSMPYLFQRKQFGQYIGDFQGMQFQYAQAAVELQAARLMTYNAARKKQHGEPFIEDAAMAKLYASQVAERTASKAIEWMGGNGFIRDNTVERFYRDAKIGAIYEGTSNIQLQTIAKFVKAKYAP
jgi:short-chain 2-methylacyl-CoA dehydrogenase